MITSSGSGLDYYRVDMCLCEACSCHPEGAVGRSCDQMTGQCRCKEGIIGRQCDRCPVCIHLLTSSLHKTLFCLFVTLEQLYTCGYSLQLWMRCISLLMMSLHFFSKFVSEDSQACLTFYTWHFSNKCVLLGRLLRVNLIKWVSNVRPPVHTSVRPSTKSFFNLNEIWSVHRGRRVMHDGMQYDPIQCQGHEPLKVGNSAIFKGYLLPIYIAGWQMTTESRHGYLNYGAIPKTFRGRIFYFCPSFCVTWLWSWQ